MLTGAVYFLILSFILLKDSAKAELHIIEPNGDEEEEEVIRSSICGLYENPNETKPRIAGGFPANVSQVPSFVRIKTREGRKCNGVIIHNSLVLTIANCLRKPTKGGKKGRLTKGVTVWAGGQAEDNPDARGMVISKNRLCLASEFEDYDETIDLDIALIHVNLLITFDEYIQPICFPSRDLDATEQAFVVGFNEKTKRKLQVLPVKREPNCDYFEGLIEPSRICFKSNHDQYQGDACVGDGGGPVYAHMDGVQTLVGLTWAGTNNCQAGKSEPSQYLDVFNYKEEYLRLAKNCIEKVTSS